MTSTSLEAQYRAAVRWYPPRWRRRFEEAMVGTLLEMADEAGRNAPASGELVDLRAQALVEWVNTAFPKDVRALVASVSVGAAAAFVLAYFFFVSWPMGSDRGTVPESVPLLGPFLNAAPLFIAPVVLMFVAAVAGSRLLAHAIAIVAVVGVVSAALVRSSTENWNGPGATTVVFVVLMVLFASVGDPRRRIPSLASFGLVGAALALFGVMRLPSGQPWEYRFVGDGGWWTMVISPWLLACTGGLVLLSVIVLLAIRRLTLAAALAVAWLPWAAAATVTLRFFAAADATSLVVGIGSVALSLFALHRLRSGAATQRERGDAPTRA